MFFNIYTNMHRETRTSGLSYQYTDFHMKFTLTLKLIIIRRNVLDTMQTPTGNAKVYCVLIIANFYLFGHNSVFSGTVHVKYNCIKILMLKFVYFITCEPKGPKSHFIKHNSLSVRLLAVNY